jgi:hypothetical protein
MWDAAPIARLAGLMARVPLLSRLLPQRPPEERSGAPRRGRVAPPPSELRRERRALLRLREQRLRDLGGLALEMYRRDHFREDLMVERCAELIGIEARIAELDALIAAQSPLRRAAPAPRCEGCGAPLLWASRFCAHCGRPLDGSARPAPATDAAAPEPEQAAPETEEAAPEAHAQPPRPEGEADA